MAGRERSETPLTVVSELPADFRSATPRWEPISSLSARTPTPLQWGKDAQGCRSQTPTSLGPLARSAALDLHSRSTTAASGVRPLSAADSYADSYAPLPQRPQSVAAFTARGSKESAQQTQPQRPRSVIGSTRPAPAPVPPEAPAAPASPGAAAPAPVPPASPPAPLDETQRPSSARLAESSARLADSSTRLAEAGALSARRPRDATLEYNASLYSQLFRRPPPPEVSLESRGPAKSQPIPPTRPTAAAAAEQLRRANLGGAPRTGRFQPTEPPARISAPSVRPHNSWCVVVEWIPPVDAPEDAEDFEFGYEVSCRCAGADSVMQVTGVSAEPFVRVQDLDPGRVFSFQVRACNKFGPGAWSLWSEPCTMPLPRNVPRHSVLDGPADDDEVPFAPASHSDEPDAALLEWDEPCGHGAIIQGYKIQYGQNPDDPESVKTISTSNNRTSTRVLGLLPNSVYFFRVQAINEAGESDWTGWSEGLATKGVEPNVPSAPRLTKQAGPVQLELCWDAPESFGFPVTHYDLRMVKEQMSVENCVEQRVDSTAEQPSILVKDLVSDTTYYFQLRAHSAMGASQWSRWSDPTRTGAQKAGLCGAVRVVSNEHKSLALEWEAPRSNGTALTGYLLRWSPDPKFNDSAGSVEVQTTSHCLVDHFDPGVVVYFQVVAKTIAGWGEFSAVSAPITVCAWVPEQPRPPTFREKTSTSVVVCVEDTVHDNGSEVLAYEAQYDIDPNFPRPVCLMGRMRVVRERTPRRKGEVKGMHRRYEQVATNFVKSGPYFFRVRAINRVGSSVWSPSSEPMVVHGAGANAKESSKVGAPWLVEVESSFALKVGWQPSLDLSLRGGGAVSSYELRYARWPEVLASEDSAEEAENEPDSPASPGRSPGGAAVTVLVRNVNFPHLSASPTLLSQFKARVSECVQSCAAERIAPEQTDLGLHETTDGCIMLQCALHNLKRAPATIKKMEDAGLQDKFRERVLAVSGIQAVCTGFVLVDSLQISQVDTPADAAPLVKHLCWKAVWNPSPPPVRVCGLNSGRAYAFQLRAITEAGPGPWSDVSACYPTKPGKPDRPKKPWKTGMDSPFALGLKFALPEANGRPVTGCLVMYQGPHESNKPEDLEWKPMAIMGDRMILDEMDCSLDKRPNPHWKEQDATEAWETGWSYTVNGLPSGAGFRYKFCCINEVGQSEWSEESDLIKTNAHMPDPCTPPFIADYQADVAAHSITVNWKPPHHGGLDISHYTLQWALNPRWEETTTVDNIVGTKHTIDDLPANSSVYVRVCAVNGIGSGKYSLTTKKGEAGNFQTLPEAPTACWNFTVTAYKKDYQSVYVKWSKPEEDGGVAISRYQIVYSLQPDMENAVEVIKRTCKECRFFGLTPGTDYYFDIRAGNTVGFGPWTGQVVHVQTTNVPPEVFVPPRMPNPPVLKVRVDMNTGDAKLAISWQCNEVYDQKMGFTYDEETQTHMIASHDLQVVGGYSDPSEEVDIMSYREVAQFRNAFTVPDNKRNSIVLTDLRPGAPYRACLRARSDSGASAWSAPSEIARMPAMPPAPVTGLCCAVAQQTTIAVEWLGPDPHGDDVVAFFFRLREDKILTGWSGGAREAPDDSAKDQPPHALKKVFKWQPQVTLAPQDVVADKSQAPGPGVLYRWVVDGLDPASHYSVEVTAQNSIGDSGPVLLEDLVTKPVEPGVPGPALAVEGTADHWSHTSGWKVPVYDGGAGILHYEVMCLSVKALTGEMPQSAEELVNSPDAKLIKVPAETRRHKTEGLSPGDGAVCMVRAINEVGASDWGALPTSAQRERLWSLAKEPAQITTPAVIHKDPPREGDYRPFSWSAHWYVPHHNGKRIDRFELVFERADGGQETVAKTSQVPVVDGCIVLSGEMHSLFSADLGLAPGGKYSVRVRAGNAIGICQEWSPYSVDYIAPPDKPTQPEAPWSDFQWPAAIEALWREGDLRGAELEACQLRYSRNRTMEPSVEVDQDTCMKDIEERSIHVKDLKHKTEYFFQIKVKNVCGWSVWSPVSEAVITKATRPGPIKTLRLHKAEPMALEVVWEEPAAHGEPILEYELALAGWDAECATRLEPLAGQAIPGTAAAQRAEMALEHYASLLPEGAERGGVAPWLLTVDADKCRIAEGLHAHRFELPGLGGSDFAVTVRSRNIKGWSDWCAPLAGMSTKPAVPERTPEVKYLAVTCDSLHCQVLVPWNGGVRIDKMEFEWNYIIGPLEHHLKLGRRKSMTARASYSGFDRSGRTGSLVVELPLPGPRPAPQRGVGGEVDFVIPNLEPGAEYDVRARSGNELGFGEWSFPVRIVTSPGRPDVPGPIKKATKEGNTVFYQRTKRHQEDEAVEVQAEKPTQRRASAVMDALRRVTPGTPRSSRIAPG